MRRPAKTSEPWHRSELEDYDRAKSDDERRRMLLLFGVDDAHEQEAERLFPTAVEQTKRKGSSLLAALNRFAKSQPFLCPIIAAAVGCIVAALLLSLFRL